MSERALPADEFDLLALLDRLEMLLEDMDDLGITTRAEAEDLMARIHERLDDTESDAR